MLNRTANVARCYFRALPKVGGQAGVVIESIENAKGAPDYSPIPLRKVAVPGTGDLSNANIYELRVMSI